MIGDFQVEEKFNPCDAHPKEEPSDTVETPCHSNDSTPQNFSEKANNVSLFQPPKLPSDVKPYTIVTPCHSSHTFSEEATNEAIQPPNLSNEHNFFLNTEIKVETNDDNITEQDSLPSAQNNVILPLDESFLKKVLLEQTKPQSSKKVHQCDTCQKIFASHTGLKYHLENVHKPNEEKQKYRIFKCDQCDKSYKNKTSLDNHVKVKHENVTLKCDICDIEMKNTSAYYNHLRENHPNKIRSYIKTKKSWAACGINVVKVVKTDCDICHKSFKTERALKHHVDSWHTKSKSDRYQCDHCEISFTAMSSLNKHKESKHLGVRYNCAKCDKSYVRQRDLNEHFKACHEGMAHECNVCGSVYTRKAILAIHMRDKHQRQYSETANDYIPKLNSIKEGPQDPLETI